MKITVVLVFASFLGVTLAEPPRFFKFARQQAAPAPAPAPPATLPVAPPAPYPPSGWKPAGPEFPLPEPSPSYGPPSSSYGPPASGYGPPPSEYGAPDSTTEEAPSTETETSAPGGGNVQSLVKQGRVDKNGRLRQQQRPVLLVPQKQSLILLDDGGQQGGLSRVQILDRDNAGGVVLRPAYVQIYQ